MRRPTARDLGIRSAAHESKRLILCPYGNKTIVEHRSTVTLAKVRTVEEVEADERETTARQNRARRNR